MRETQVRSLGREDPLKKEMVNHSSILAWRIPQTEKPCRLQSTGSQRVGNDWATSPSPSTHLQSKFPRIALPVSHFLFFISHRLTSDLFLDLFSEVYWTFCSFIFALLHSPFLSRAQLRSWPRNDSNTGGSSSIRPLNQSRMMQLKSPSVLL